MGEIKRIVQKRIILHYQLFLLLLPALIYFLVFHYAPMYGVQIAFKDFTAVKGINGSLWAGFKHFNNFINSPSFGLIISSTIKISLYTLLVGFPFPILLSLMMNEVKNKTFKKMVQTVTYAPHFISMVVLVGMINLFFSPVSGIVNQLIQLMGGKAINFLVSPQWFIILYVLSHVWQNTGWSSIIYIAALASIDLQLHEAAITDGASKWQRLWHINIPGILPTIVILFILNSGHIMSVGFEKVFLMQNPLNMQASDVISTYVYRTGLMSAEYSFASAVGLFTSVINFVILLMVNAIAKRVNETSLW